MSTHDFVVWVKAFAHSVFKRTQRHYQRLSVYTALIIRLALGHGNYVCRNMMICYMKYMFAVGGDMAFGAT